MVAKSQKTNRTKVGIFMPAYNQGIYIDDAIDSLKKQTFQNFIVHIVDDGSTDGITPDKLDSIDYDKAKIYKNKKNIGPSPRFRHHASRMEAEYIFVLCADDILEPGFIEKCVNFLDKKKSYGAVSPWVQYFGESNTKLEFSEKDNSIETILATYKYLGSAMMRKEALEQIEYGPELRGQSDYCRFVSMLTHGWKLGVIKEHLFLLRVHSDSNWQTYTAERESEFRHYFFKRYQEPISKNFEYIYVQYATALFEKERWIGHLQKVNDRLESENHKLKRDNKGLKNELETLHKKRIFVRIFKRAKRVLLKK